MKTFFLDEFEIKQEIAYLILSIEPNIIYNGLFKLNVENYLTTNYDYGYLDSIVYMPEITKPIHEFSTENIYSIRRLKNIPNINQKKKYFWQIHGEIRKPATIMLGLDHYCGSIGKIDSYIKGFYRYSPKGEEITEDSIEKKMLIIRLTIRLGSNSFLLQTFI